MQQFGIRLQQGTAARMSSAPPRPASIRAMPVAIRPSARARGSVTGSCAAAPAGLPVPSRPRVAEVVGRVHRVGQERWSHRRRAGGSAAAMQDGRALPAAIRCAPRSPPAVRVSRTPSEPPRRPRQRRLADVLIQQRQSALAHARPSRPSPRRAAVAPARTSSSGVSRADALEGARGDRVRGPGDGVLACLRQAGRPPPRRDARSLRRDATPDGPRRARESPPRQRDAPRADLVRDAPEYVAARSSGCRNSTRSAAHA